MLNFGERLAKPFGERDVENILHVTDFMNNKLLFYELHKLRPNWVIQRLLSPHFYDIYTALGCTIIQYLPLTDRYRF